MKKLWKKIHLYLALLFSLPLVILSITGALLVYEQEIEAFFKEESVKLQQDKTFIAIAPLIEQYENQFKDYRLSFIRAPQENLLAYKLFFRAKDKNIKPRRKTITLNPYNGERLNNEKNFIETSFSFILAVHRRLTIDGWGRYIMATSSVGLIILALSGFYISLPKRNLFRRSSLKGLFTMPIKPRNSLVFHYNLHKVMGIYLFLILILIAFTGINFTWGRNYIYPAINFITNAPLPPKAPKIQASKAPRNLVAAIHTIEEKYGQNNFRYISMPRKAVDAYKFRIKDDFNPGGFIEAFINPYTGEFISAYDQESYSITTWLKASNYYLHVGTIFGKFGQVLWLLTSLALSFFVYSGIYLWLKRRKT